jgi:hypothetical protein
LSIGAGAEKDWARGVDFVVDNGKLYRLNLKKMVANGVKVEELTTYFSQKDEVGLKSKLTGKLDAVSDFSMTFPVESDNDVKTFVKNQLNGKPVLVGSSLKGAIRSVLFQYFDGDSKDGKEVFGSSTVGDEFMRFIKISDAEFDSTELVNTKIFNLRKHNREWLGGWKHKQTDRQSNNDFTNETFQPTGFNTLYESLMPKQKGCLSLMLSERTFQNFNIRSFYENKRSKLVSLLSTERDPEKQQKIQKDINDVERLLNTVEQKENIIRIENLFAIINEHTEDYLRKERAFFEKYSTDKTDEIVKSINALLQQIPDDNSYCILKMSAGSGFHSITGDWQFDDYSINGLDTSKKVSRGLFNGDKSAKSRKIAVWDGNYSLMGFVKLRAISDEELRQLEVKRAEEQHRRELERQAELEAECLRKEKEEQERKQLQEQEDKYKVLVSEGDNLYVANSIEEALTKYQKAKSIFPQKFDLDKTIDELKQQVAAIQQSKEIEARKRQESEDRKKSNLISLSEKIANAQKLPTLYGNVKQWMKQNGVDLLSDKDREALYSKIKDIVASMKDRERTAMKGLGKDLDMLVGSDTAQKWFNEIIN